MQIKMIIFFSLQRLKLMRGEVFLKVSLYSQKYISFPFHYYCYCISLYTTCKKTCKLKISSEKASLLFTKELKRILKITNWL